MTLAEARDVLGIKAGASEAAVRTAYYRLAMRWHPDRPGGDTAKMDKINRARATVMNPPPAAFDPSVSTPFFGT